jgi:hypothetical protein
MPASRPNTLPSNRRRYVRSTLPLPSRSAALLLLTLTLPSCAALSNATPPVIVSAPVLTPLPEELAKIEPPPSGSYSAALTRSRAEWRRLLTDTQMKSAP